MKFGIHHASWLDSSNPAEAFETVKAKAQWAEDRGFAWFSVMDHMIQIPGVGAPEEPVLEGWTVLAVSGALRRRRPRASDRRAQPSRKPAQLPKLPTNVRLVLPRPATA